MGSVRLDDGFTNHPKVVNLSLEARWAYMESLCYAAKYETDGVVPASVAANGLLRGELLASGLWENGSASIVIHDYLTYNPSKEQLGRERAEATARSDAASNAARMRWAMHDAAQRHDAEIVVSPKGLVVGSSSKSKEAFASFWTIYPRKVGKPKALAAFLKALERAPADVILAGAQRFHDDPNREPQFTPHPTTWLNRDGWGDDPLPARAQRAARNVDNLHALAKRMKS